MDDGNGGGPVARDLANLGGQLKQLRALLQCCALGLQLDTALVDYDLLLGDLRKPSIDLRLLRVELRLGRLELARRFGLGARGVELLLARVELSLCGVDLLLARVERGPRCVDLGLTCVELSGAVGDLLATADHLL